MEKAILRPSLPDDEKSLRKIWRESFGDSDNFLDDFFAFIYKPESSIVAQIDGYVVSAFYFINGVELVSPERSPLPCPYLYSLGTLPEYRGKGIGAAIARECVKYAAEKTGGIPCLHPSQDGLFSWYDAATEAKPTFSLKELSFSSPFIARESCLVSTLSPREYNLAREKLLQGHEHARFDQKLIDWQCRICRSCGGNLFSLKTDSGEGCAAVETQNGKLLIKELLLPDGELESAIASLSLIIPSVSCTIRSPCFFSTAVKALAKPFIVSVPSLKGELPSSDSAYWGFCFD